MIDPIIIDQAESANSSGCEIERGRGTQTTGTNHQDGRRLELPLTLLTHTRNRKMPGVTKSLVVVEWRKFHRRWKA